VTLLPCVDRTEVTNSDTNTLILLNSLTVGGSEKKAVFLANDLVGRVPRVVLAYLNEPNSLLKHVQPGVVTACLDRKGKFSIGTLYKLRKLIQQHRIRTVFAVNLYPALYASLVKIATFDRSFRLVATVNTTDPASSRQRRQMLLYQNVLRYADSIVFGAEFQRDLWTRRYPHLSRNNSTYVLYNGVDPSKFCRADFDMDDSVFKPAARYVLGTVGKLRPEKSQIEVVRAVHLLRAREIDVGAMLIGDGPERSRIEAEIRDLGVEDQVRVIGEVDDVRPYLAALDFFVLPSVTETFSNATLEAMAMACPIAATRVGGMQEMLQFGGGFTYQPGDLNALCDQLSVFLTDKSMLMKLGEQARRAVVENFSWNSMVDNYIRIAVGSPGNDATISATNP